MAILWLFLRAIIHIFLVKKQERLMRKIFALISLLVALSVALAACGAASGPKLTMTTKLVMMIGEQDMELSVLGTDAYAVSKVEDEVSGSSSWVTESAKLEKFLADAEAEVLKMNASYNSINGISHPEITLESKDVSDLIKAKGVLSTKGKFEGKEIVVIYRVTNGTDLKYTGLSGDLINFSANVGNGMLVADFSEPIENFVSFLKGEKQSKYDTRDVETGIIDPSDRALKTGNLGTVTLLNTNDGLLCNQANMLLAFIADQNGVDIVRKVWRSGPTMIVSLWVDTNPPASTSTPAASPLTTPVSTITQ